MPSSRRLEREAAKRRRHRRGQAIAALSSLVVLGGLAALILTSPGWPEVRETFFNWEVFKDSFPDVAQGLLARREDLRRRRAGDPRRRTGRRPGADRPLAGGLPAAPALRRLRRRFPRHPDDPAGLPDRLRGPGPAPRRGAERPGRPRRDRPHPLLQRLRRRGLPRRGQLGPPRPARRRPRRRPDREPGDAPRDPAAGDPAGGAAAAERLRRPAEGRRPDLDPRPAGGLPRSADHRGADLQLHAAGRRGAALPGGHHPARRGSSTAWAAPRGRCDERARRAGPRAARSDQGFRRARGPARDRPDRARARSGGADRRLGLGQVDPAALRRPAGGDRRRRRLPRRRGDHRPRRRPGRGPPPARRSSSRPTTSSRT